MNKKLLHLVKFAVKYPEWQSYAKDSETVQLVCAAVNLGILELSDISRQFRLKSPTKANDFIDARS